MNQLFKQSGILNISQTYKPARPVAEIALLFKIQRQLGEDGVIWKCSNSIFMTWLICVFTLNDTR